MVTESRFSRRGAVVPLWVPAAALVTLAAALRFYRLDAQLWLDEVAALTHLRKPVLEILSTFPGFFPHPLYELLGHAGLRAFGENPVAMRLPAAIFGVAGVLIFFRLAHRLLGRGEALLAGALLATSYHHIFFSQDARGYTAFLFLALTATELLLMLLEQMRWRTAFAYAGVAALTVYAHPFGLFVPTAQLLVALLVAASRHRTGSGRGRALAQLIATAGLTGLLILGLYAPFVRGSVQYLISSRAVRGYTVFDLLPELLEGLRVAFHGWLGLTLAASVAVVGMLDSTRRHPVVMGLLVAPLLVGAAAVALLGMAVLHPRYFILALPVGYLVGTRGLAVAARAVLTRIRFLSPAYLAVVQAALCVLIVVLAALPLRQYYAIPKQDFLGALRDVGSLAGEDRVVAAQLAGYGIRDYYAPTFPVVNNLPELRAVEAESGRVWVVTTLERILSESDPALFKHLRTHYRVVRVLPGTIGDGAMRIYVRNDAAVPDR